MAIEKAFELIEENIDEADFCGPISEDKIITAEKMLGITFPHSYKRFLSKYGCGDLFEVEIFGIIKDPKTDGNGVPNGIWLTKDLRVSANLPEQFLVVSESGDGGQYVIDTSIKNEKNESPVLFWHLAYSPEKIADNFGEFLYNSFMEMM